MKMSKSDRQEAILRLIKEKDIETQEGLVSELIAAGLSITQATVSRDIKDLGIIKVATPEGNTKYRALNRTGDVAPQRLLYVFSQSIVSCQNAGNLVIIKTLPGMAQGAASALDSLALNGVIGTIGGDDTVFAATKNEREAEVLAKTIFYINDKLNQED